MSSSSQQGTNGDERVSTSENSEFLFCSECGSMQYADGERVFCDNCHSVVDRGGSDQLIVGQTQIERGPVVAASNEGETVRPTRDVKCPECGPSEATWQLKQIRAADESETRFFTCINCDHTWREDDH